MVTKKQRQRNIGIVILVGMFLILNINLIHGKLLSVVDIGDGVFCEDSDGGNNINVKGYVQLTIPDIGFEDEKIFDYCVNPLQVGEYSCADDVALNSFVCAFGCGDGKCKSSIEDPGSGCTPEENSCLFDDVICCEGLFCIEGECQKQKSDFDIKSILIILGIILLIFGIMKGGKK